MNEIGLQEVIYQVKRELLEPNPAAQARDPYPLFAIEKVDLEIALRITRGTDRSVKLTVLEVAEVSLGRSTSQEQSHIVRVTLTPLLSHDELVAEALKDSRIRQNVQHQSQRALIRHDEGLLGEPE
jgi:hypothetical protein